MFKRIVVTLDGSEMAEVAIPYAQELALRLDSELDIVTVCEPTGETEAMQRTYIERIASGLGKLGLKLHSVVLYGKPAEAILDYVELNKIDLIVVSTHGRSGVGRWMLGSVADKILRSSSCPVLLVSAGKSRGKKQESVALTRILLPLDGSQLGEAAVPLVEEVASRIHAEVVLLQVITPLDKVVPIEGYAVHLADMYGDMTTQAKSYMAKVEQRLKQKGINVRHEVLSGLPATSILEYSQNNEINLVAMSTHGRSGLSRWVMGSVADKVLHAGAVPLLLVKASRMTESKA